jgi:hypothetical protein
MILDGHRRSNTAPLTPTESCPTEAQWLPMTIIRAAVDVDSGDTCGNSCITLSGQERSRHRPEAGEIQSLGYTGGISQLKYCIAGFKPVESDPVVCFEALPVKQVQVVFTTIWNFLCPYSQSTTSRQRS